MMTAVAAIVFEPKPSRPAPGGSSGILGWLRGNLFYSRWSTVLTLAVGYFVVSRLLDFYGWAVTDAVWHADSHRECLDQSPYGACWAGIDAWMGAYIYGRYPAAERWRGSRSHPHSRSPQLNPASSTPSTSQSTSSAST